MQTQPACWMSGHVNMACNPWLETWDVAIIYTRETRICVTVQWYTQMVHTGSLGPINNIPTMVQIIDWHWPGDKPVSEVMLIILLMHICITGPQWVKQLVMHMYQCEKTQFGLVVSYDNINLCQNLLRQSLVVSWRQAITWINVNLSPVSLYVIHLRTFSQVMLKI